MMASILHRCCLYTSLFYEGKEMEYFQVRYSDGFMKKKNGIFQVT